MQLKSNIFLYLYFLFMTNQYIPEHHFFTFFCITDTEIVCVSKNTNNYLFTNALENYEELILYGCLQADSPKTNQMNFILFSFSLNCFFKIQMQKVTLTCYRRHHMRRKLKALHCCRTKMMLTHPILRSTTQVTIQF